MVGADGRFSRVRKLPGLGDSAIKASAPMDVSWFRLPRQDGDTHGLMGRVGPGHLLIEFKRGAEWQVAVLISKASHPQLQASGFEALRHDIAAAGLTHWVAASARLTRQHAQRS
jgi:hypothetical protein